MNLVPMKKNGDKTDSFTLSPELFSSDHVLLSNQSRAVSSTSLSSAAALGAAVAFVL